MPAQESKGLNVRWLGLQPYVPTFERMQSFTNNRDENTPDELWILEHEAVFTQGQAGKEEHLIDPGDIPVVQADRGGQVTFHGPGQLVVYLLVDLKRNKLGVRDLVTLMEQSVVSVLGDYDIQAAPRADAPGVYVDQRKICSLGLRVRKGRSFHGLALNVDMDLSPFLRINPCGYQGMEMIQVKDFAPQVRMDSLSDALVKHLASGIGYNKWHVLKGW